MNERKTLEQRSMSFSLRRNPQKMQDGNRPDMIGQLNIDGIDYDLSAWEKVASSGAHWFSGQVKVTPKVGPSIYPEKKQEPQKPVPYSQVTVRGQPWDDEDDSRIPF